MLEGARMTQRSWYTYTIFKENGLIYCKWGVRNAFSFHRRALQKIIEKHYTCEPLLLHLNIFLSLSIFGRVALQQMLFSKGPSSNVTVYLAKAKQINTIIEIYKVQNQI